MRRRWRGPLAMSLAVVALMSLNLQAPQASLAQTPGVYIALGDSIGAGIGSSLPRERGNAAIVASWLVTLSGEPVPFENLAVPGETAATFIAGGQLQRFRETVARSKAAGIPIAAVSVSLGGNELLALDAGALSDRQAGLDEFTARYSEAVAVVRSEIGPDTPLVVSTNYDLTEGDREIRFSDSWWIEQFNTVIRYTAGEYGAQVAELSERFKGRISEYTLYPYDVHPSNQGHAAIARAIWAALRLDTEPPSVTVPSSLEATRSTPTISFTIRDNVGISSVNVSSDDVAIRGPFETASGEYSVLLDLGATDLEEVALTIEIGDDAGNVTREVVTLQDAVGDRGESQ